MPRISNDPLKAFVALRASLAAKRESLLAELADIDAALGSMGAAQTGKTKTTPAASGSKLKGSKRAKNELSLKDAVIKAIGKHTLSKAEILTGVEKLGYVFTAKNPTNSLNTLLYAKGTPFKNNDGKFSVA